jgi:hypothetical protein
MTNPTAYSQDPDRWRVCVNCGKSRGNHSWSNKRGELVCVEPPETPEHVLDESTETPMQPVAQPLQKRRYFVSFTYWRDAVDRNGCAHGGERQGVACTEVERDKPIADFADIKEMIEVIRSVHGYETVVINSWQLFEGQQC